MTSLPIDPLLPDVRACLSRTNALVLIAPPGAGKTTRVPLALLDEPWLTGRKVVLLEPRRLAARAAAQRMAATLGEAVGQTVGYQIRLDRRIGRHTRIEVVTEGILTRRLQDDTILEDVGLVIFDEFHERSLNADLGLALTLDVQRKLRPELRIAVMSATLDGAAVAHLMNDAAVLKSEGAAFPVETHYLPQPRAQNPVPAAVLAIERAIEETAGDILVFLPGEREIRSAERTLQERVSRPDIVVAPLYGALSQTAQDVALAPTIAGGRKIVLATSIAETSLTIEDVRVVIDAGFQRVPRFDPATGLTRLETERVSQASADQRRGRAGRLGPGICYRLWPEAETRGLAQRATPEILQADLASLALELALWGVREPTSLTWLDPPPAAAFMRATALLVELEALRADGRVTEHGRAIARLPLPPRLAHMVLRAKELGLGPEGATLAALLGERDVLTGPGAKSDADLRLRLGLVSDGNARDHLPPGCELRHATLRHTKEAARQIGRQLGLADRPLKTKDIGRLAALAYPDRIAQRRATGGYRMANGRGAALSDEDPLGNEPWLAIAEVSGANPDGRVFLCAPLDPRDIEEMFASLIRETEEVVWDARNESVTARKQRKLGALLLEDSTWRDPPADAVKRAVIEGVRAVGIAALPWTPLARDLQARVGFLHGIDGAKSEWPDFSDAALDRDIENWLTPYLDGIRARAALNRLDLAVILNNRLDHRQRRRLDEEAPTDVAIPTGRHARLDYAVPDGPVLSVKLQELFGLAETPRIAGGRVAVLVELLSPAGRPVQKTRDLASFWRTGYVDVKRDLKGRYPKHPWPDDPTTAKPTARTRRKS